ncbi:MAG TPA: RNA 2',3'-cyclic phosphodiesterase [Clostridiales bacterium]|nr:RNA 2',3'-cyclic phosphodiesterase [Clostridiales bacterium]
MINKDLDKRVFIAINFSNEVRLYLSNMQQKLKAVCKSGNFSHPDNLHLTLRFIGSTGTDGIEKLKAAIDEAARNSRIFEMSLSGLGQFASRDKHIIWAGIRYSRKLEELYNNLQAALEKAGYPKETRKFTPHITLAREVIPESSLSETLDAANVSDEIRMVVDRIYLMESTRVNGKLKYITLYSKHLLMHKTVST